MSRASRAALRFVRALMDGLTARPDQAGRFRIGAAALGAAEVQDLCAAGVLLRRGEGCAAGAGARTWLRRQLLEEEPFAAQHRTVSRGPEGTRLQPRVNMSYNAAHVAGGGNSAAEISDMAAEARRELADLMRILPRDCAGVILDVCGLLKGLQQVETERGWPRRSAKLVLRIGLEQLAAHYGYGPVAVGAPSRRRHAWLDEGARPDRFE